MDRLEAMSLVLAVAETGSLAGAARRLRTPVATASRKISDLEAHLHAKLFDRSGRKLAPTDAGGTYVAAAKRILADVGEAERAASGEYTAPTGELIVTAPISSPIGYERFPTGDMWPFVQDESDIAIAVRSRLVVSNVEAACDAARAGVGLTWAFSYHVAASVEAGTLTTVLDDYQPAALPVSLLYGAGRFLPIKLRAFLDFAAPRLRASLAS